MADQDRRSVGASFAEILVDESPDALIALTVDGRVRFGGDEDLFDEVAGLFLLDCPVRLAAIKMALDSEDAERIRIAAHALKGAAGNIAAMKLFEASKTLELSTLPQVLRLDLKIADRQPAIANLQSEI